MIGKDARDVSVDEAMSYVLGSVLNSVCGTLTETDGF